MAQPSAVPGQAELPGVEKPAKEPRFDAWAWVKDLREQTLKVLYRVEQNLVSRPFSADDREVYEMVKSLRERIEGGNHEGGDR